MKRVLLFSLASFASAASVLAADTLSYRVRQVGNWAFYGTENPTVELVASNQRGVQQPFSMQCLINDHNGKPVFRLGQSGVVPPKDSADVSFSFLTMSPGFYNALILEDGTQVRSLNVAYEPEKIAPAGGVEGQAAKEDFKHFADKVSLERRDLRPQFSILRNKNLSGREKNVYDFRMVSRGDEAVTGYMAFPRGKKDLAVMVTFVMLGEGAANPLADFTAPADMAELVVYLRGRGAGEEYLKNLLTDMALSIDFVAQRAETNPARIFTQGSGLAGACSFVAGALDERVAVSFVADPLFSTFTEHFSVESICAGVKNPALFGMGLQEKVQILNENFCIYNGLQGNKEYFIFPDRKTVERKQWRYIRDTFLARTGK